MTKKLSENPFRPGAGHMPPYLAGRQMEKQEFLRLLRQDTVLENLVLTGLRGVGKTVLLEELKPLAQNAGWLWTGNDLSESTSLTEERIARRIAVDLATLLAPIYSQSVTKHNVGFEAKPEVVNRPLHFEDLWKTYETTPGLADDKLKALLGQVGKIISGAPVRGIVFAYDEAQNLSDHAAAKEYPLSLLLDVFSHFQRTRKHGHFMLVLTGLPTLFPKLNETRTYTERMFHVMHLQRLSIHDAGQAILKPISISNSPLRFSLSTIKSIIKESGGYPYFIQYMCKEVFDAWIGKIGIGVAPSVPMQDIIEKLDQDFFSPRWARTTDRQQDFMKVIATLTNASDEFSVQDIVAASRQLLRASFSPSHATQILQALSEKGLVYRSRRGGYCFAVPLLATFIDRQPWNPASLRVAHH